jgi:tetratricopeptide (TPR) repeat protein
MDHKLLESDQRFFLVGSRAGAYFASGDWQQALDDYNAAIKLAPHYGKLYYDRGVVFASRSNDDAALQDFDTAMGLDSKLVVPALLYRAKIYAARRNFSGAVADYSRAISLQPKIAELWSDRGYVDLSQRDYNDAVKDEAEAIQLDPKLARAYYLRSIAFEDLGNRTNAVGDLRTAVGIDASLARYVLIQGKSVTLTLPPL